MADDEPVDAILDKMARLAPREYEWYRQAAAATVRAVMWRKRAYAVDRDVPDMIQAQLTMDVQVAREAEAEATEKLVVACEQAGGVDD